MAGETNHAQTHPKLRPLAVADSAPQVPCFDARELTGQGTTAHLSLDGVLYVLRITRQGKLILTK